MNRELYIVDDNADHHFLLYKLLKDSDMPYSVRFFESGKTLYRHVQALLQTGQSGCLPALVLLDLNMPGMNGLELLRLLRQVSLAPYKQLLNIPVVIMSSDITAVQINQCYLAGANAVVFKPLDFNLMRTTIQSICKFWIKEGQDAKPGNDLCSILVKFIISNAWSRRSHLHNVF